MSSFKPAKTSLSRVFLIEFNARQDHVPTYESCMRMMGVSRGYGDQTMIEVPNPDKYDSFIEVGSISGGTERPTTSLEGRYPLDTISTMFRLARIGCPFDIQLHLGECEDPRVFSEFKKAIILENASITNLSTGDLGALASGDNGSIEETIELSAEDIYEVVPLTFAEKAASIVTNEVVDIALCDAANCGGCDEVSDGSSKYFSVTKAAGGSPSTPPDLVSSLDGGATWFAHDIDTLSTAQDADAVDCVGAYIVVVSNDAGSLNYILKADAKSTIDPVWTEVTTGFVAGGEPNDISSYGSGAFIVGDMGYVYLCEDPTSGVEVLDAGVATISQLNAVKALSSTFAVAVGNDGSVIYTSNGTSWANVTVHPVGVGVHLNCVMLQSETEWWVGASNGNAYVTFDSGATWNLATFPGSGTGSVTAIEKATKSVFYMAHQTAATKGRILRTFNAGQEWVVMPESAGNLPACDLIDALAVSETNPNIVVGVGLADNATDGYIVVGE